MGTWNGGTWHTTRISYWQGVMGVNEKKVLSKSASRRYLQNI